jgi:spermidine/putrescine-binding protein
VLMRKKKLKVVYMRPKEGPLSWIGMLMLGKNTSRSRHAHAFANAWSSVRSAEWLENNYGYGHANLRARPNSSDLLRVLRLTNPNAVKEPSAHIDRHIPRRALYARLWQEVKAS